MVIFRQIENQNDILEAAKLRIKYLNELYPDTPTDKFDILLKQNQEYLQQHLQKDCFVTAAFQNGKIVSTAYAGIYQKSPNMRINDGIYAEIYGVYTTPEFRKQRLATKTIRLLLSILRKHNIQYIQLDASEDGFHMYQQLGFQTQTEQYKKMWLHTTT